MKKTRKVIPVLMAATMLSTLAIACSKQDAATSNKVNPPASSGNSVNVYPIQTDKTISLWSEITGNLVGVKANLADVPFFQEWQKRTGVKLKITSPVTNQAREGLNVMLASGDLPDIIDYNFMDKFPGGPEKAIKDGFILPLNDLMDKNAPNLKKFLKSRPDIDKMVKTDGGSYFAFPFIRGEEYMQVFGGPMIRKDWLDDLGMPVPTTMDEWYTTLKAFKEKKGAAAPLSFLGVPKPLESIYNGAFIGAYGIHRQFYQENGQIKFGPSQPVYKDFLTTMRKWYAEGLLDKNIATVDLKALDANIASNATGATIGNTGSGMGKWQPLIEAKDPKAKLVAVPYPVLKKGDKPKFGQKDQPFGFNGMHTITTKAKEPEIAAKFLDYGYSEEGHMLFNFGIEGVSYKMENGYPKFTDLLLKNPDKLAPGQAMSLYIRASYNGPFVQDKRYLEQYYGTQEQRDSIGIWQTEVDKFGLPPITPNPTESSEMAKIMTDVNTLIDEMTLKVILGSESIDNFDKYMEKLKSLKLDRAIEIQKAALDRYNKR
jgi:putative aldouronate transport system substrate-binding protein